MNSVESVRRRLVDIAVAQTAEVVEPFTRTAAGAAALRSGIQYEAFLREQQHRSLTIFSKATGVHTQEQRWARTEATERAVLAPWRPTHGRGVPAIFWHGPDQVSTPPKGLVVLVNGWTASGLVWPTDLVGQLEQEFDVVRVDNRGSGYSRTAPRPFTMATMADDLADVIRAVGAQSATIVGLSMGGMIAQETAIRHPHLVERLVLCGTRPPAPAAFPPSDAVAESLMSAPREGQPLRDYFERTWAGMVGPGFADRAPDAFAEMIDQITRRPTPHAGVLTQLRAIGSWHGSDRLARITARTVVIHGRDDQLIQVGNGMRLAQLIPGAEYVELPGVGHIVPFEAPDALLAQIISG